MESTQFSNMVRTSLSFEDAIAKITEYLAAEGFGILTEIDVQATLKKKLDKDMAPYRILGACNPPLANKAITSEPSIGLLLPCNVVVREQENGKILVEFIDPDMMVELIDNSAVKEVACEAKEKLKRVCDAL